MIETKDIPKHWQKKKLGEVCEVLDNLRKPINSTERQQRISGKSQEELYPYYGATGQVGWIDDFLTDGDFILIGEDGAPFLDIYKDKAYKIKGKTWVNNHAHILKGKEQFLLDDFALHYLNSINYREFVNGTTRLKLTKSSLVEIPFVVPPLPEQQAIVAKIEELLSELENGKQQLLTAQQQLKVYRQSLLKWAFEGKLTNKKVKEGELPKGWKEVQIKDVATMNPKTPNRENISKQMEVQFLPMKLVEEIINKIHLTEIRKYEDVLKGSYTPFINGDVIFAKVTPCMENGKIAIVDNLKNGIGFGSSEFHVLRAGDKIKSNFLFYFLVQDGFRHKAASEMTGAVGLRRVPKQFIENYSIPLPSIKEQQLIVSELESKLTVCDKIEETISHSLQQAETLRQSILKKAFEGKLVTTEKMTVVNELH